MTIGSASLSSGAFFTPALYAFDNANKELSNSTVKLSTGSRLNRAGDVAAALSIATRMSSQLAVLRQATNNAVQGDSLLQVAAGGLQNISDILDKMNSLATQANSASLTDADRAYLQVQLSSYLDEIDRIAGTTSFNKIKLLNGNLSGAGSAQTATTNSDKAQATLLFTSIATTNTVVLNGVTFTADTDFAVGGTVADTVENLKNALNSSTNTAISKATYTRSGDSLIITADSGGTQAQHFIVNKASSTSTFTVGGASTQTANIYTLANADDSGLGYGSTIATGTIGDAVVNTQSQTKGSVTLNFSGNASATETLNIDDGNGSLLAFTFTNSTSPTSTQITVGSTVEETLQNIVKQVSQYSGTSNYVTSQLDFTINGSSLTISNKAAGNVADFAGAVPDITETIANATLSAATITGGTNTGINVNGVNNKDFIGTVSGFEATYVGADSITASITVGDHTYSAAITDTTPTSGNSTIRFSSTDGGYFDVQLAQNQGFAVSDQTTADTYAAHLDTAIRGLTFYQSRKVSNVDATGAFSGGSAKLQLSDFSNTSIDSISVTAPTATDGTIDITINGTIFRANTGLGGSIGAYETVKFTSLTNSNDALYLTNGSTAQDLSTSDAAAQLEQDLRDFFALDAQGSGTSFQVGTENSDRVTVTIGNSTTDRLFNGATPSISSQDDAAAAQDLIATALTTVLTSIANVGALQARFQYVQDVNQKITENLTTAHSQLADTDIAEESTNYALAALKLNSGIAVIAQTQKLQSGLLQVLQHS